MLCPECLASMEEIMETVDSEGMPITIWRCPACDLEIDELNEEGFDDETTH